MQQQPAEPEPAHPSPPLTEAALNGDCEKVCALLHRGDDVEAADEFGYTALMGAAEWGKSQVLEVLLQWGAEVGTKDVDGETALMWAKNYVSNDPSGRCVVLLETAQETARDIATPPAAAAAPQLGAEEDLSAALGGMAASTAAALEAADGKLGTLMSRVDAVEGSRSSSSGASGGSGDPKLQAALADVRGVKGDIVRAKADIRRDLDAVKREMLGMQAQILALVQPLEAGPRQGAAAAAATDAGSAAVTAAAERPGPAVAGSDEDFLRNM